MDISIHFKVFYLTLPKQYKISKYIYLFLQNLKVEVEKYFPNHLNKIFNTLETKQRAQLTNILLFLIHFLVYPCKTLLNSFHAFLLTTPHELFLLLQMLN